MPQYDLGTTSNFFASFIDATFKDGIHNKYFEYLLKREKYIQHRIFIFTNGLLNFH